MKLKHASIVLISTSGLVALNQLIFQWEQWYYRPFGHFLDFLFTVSILILAIILLKGLPSVISKATTPNPIVESNNSNSSSNEDKSVAILSYITLVGFIIAIVQHSSNKTRLGAYHLRQVVGFIITGFALGIFLLIISIPMFALSYRDAADYAVFVSIISFLCYIFILVIYIISLVNAINGYEKPAPIFGKLFAKWFIKMFN